MAGDSREIRTHAKQYFASHRFGPDEQTRICLFLQGVKGINATILAKVEFQPFEWLPYKFLHNQCFKEVELSTLLGKSTVWSTNPFVYLDATNLNLSLWQETDAGSYLQGFLQLDRSFYEYLALSQAFMADIRFLPLLPVDMPLDTPFLQTLKEVEEENGRQMQTQMRLLKDLDVGLEQAEKEQIIEKQHKAVNGLFERLLSEITAMEA
ncbi:hypothetical protein CAI21_15410 [Alkalilimnicola ehrlichii]|uniref:Uncharacterized protein n=1 Tax=Alkalilimnicola ehrlichii TaxID=351052 RepID=A0A3E0WTX4_9GAMM|nr:hypothetical protein [Alkalilimnicola ehrlichii]RFA27231.1 hypothetical protein CAI21_15410 [Alkalilimnicola ehrlichii]RFA35407.1 hypothetical protein CAL65_13085 [Alkalilimnicola ehrlichii]